MTQSKKKERKKKQGRKCQHIMCSQPLPQKGEETHLGWVQTRGWVHLSPHKHVGSGPQESFLAFKETECSRSKNQSKSTTWLLIKPEKSGEMQTVYQWIILPNPRTPSPGFKELFKDFAIFFIEKKEKSHLLHNIFGSAKLRVLRECCVQKNKTKRNSQRKLWCCHQCAAEHVCGWGFVVSAFFSLPPDPACSHQRHSVLPHPSKKRIKRRKKGHREKCRD